VGGRRRSLKTPRMTRNLRELHAQEFQLYHANASQTKESYSQGGSSEAQVRCHSIVMHRRLYASSW
jgi:hypothetical protein